MGITISYTDHDFNQPGWLNGKVFFGGFLSLQKDVGGKLLGSIHHMARILVDRNPWRSYKFNWDLHIWKAVDFSNVAVEVVTCGIGEVLLSTLKAFLFGLMVLCASGEKTRILRSCDGGKRGKQLHEVFPHKKGTLFDRKNRRFFVAHQQKRWVPTQLEVIDGEFLLAHLQPSDFKDALQTQHLAHSIEVGLLGAKFYVKVDIFQPRYLKIYMVGLHGQCGNSRVCISPLGVMALGLYISWHFGRYILYVVLNTSRFLRETWDSRVVRGPIS